MKLFEFLVGSNFMIGARLCLGHHQAFKKSSAFLLVMVFGKGYPFAMCFFTMLGIESRISAGRNLASAWTHDMSGQFPGTLHPVGAHTPKFYFGFTIFTFRLQSNRVGLNGGLVY
jgi:hypothetical protein